jgi:glutamate racemase
LNTAKTHIANHSSTKAALPQTIKIGFADSGVGGLMMQFSVLKNLYPVMEFLNKIKGVNFELIHVGHNKYAPFGEKEPSEIELRTKEMLEYCTKNLGCNITVLACNTASAVFDGDLEKEFKDKYPEQKILPIIKPSAKYIVDKAITNRGVFEGIDRAQENPSKVSEAINNSDEPLRIGVLCTRYTKKSGKYQEEIEKCLKDKGITNYKIIMHAPKNWVSLMENKADPFDIFNDIGAEMVEMVKNEKLAGKKLDTLGLFCTHYPFVKRSIKKNIEHFNCKVDKLYGQGKLFAENLLDMYGLTKNDLTNDLIKYEKPKYNKNKNFLSLTSYHTGLDSPKETLSKLLEATFDEFYKNDEATINLGKALTKKKLGDFIQSIEYKYIDIEKELANFKDTENETGASRVVG